MRHVRKITKCSGGWRVTIPADLVAKAKMEEAVYVILESNEGDKIEIRPLNEETIKRIKS
jgi:hypothetical protein